jgi:hypothetical protein
VSAQWKSVVRQEVKKGQDGWEAVEGEQDTNPVDGTDADRTVEPRDTTGLMGHIETQLVSMKIVSEKIDETGDPKQVKKPNKNQPQSQKKKNEQEQEDKLRHWRVTEHHHQCKLMLDSTSAKVDLDVNHRKKGLLWFATYGVDFGSTYTVKNPTNHPIDVTMSFGFPSYDAIYDNMKVTLKGKDDAHVVAEDGQMVTRFELPANGTQAVYFGYQSRGMDRWNYSFGPEVKMVRDFELEMDTDFAGIDFPRGSISPDRKVRHDDGLGWKLVWDKESVVSGLNIGMLMPHRINPGPLAQAMTFHAPVSLFFFFFVMFILQVLRKIQIHPMNYFFIAASFFAFNLLFSYLVDHLDIFLAFCISSAVSIFLVASYLRIVVGLRFALVEAGISQLIYQVLFSLAHFMDGYTGLTITIGAIVTLAIVMHLTARTQWEHVFRLKSKDSRATSVHPEPAATQSA